MTIFIKHAYSFTTFAFLNILMALILNLETATSVCSVSLVQDGMAIAFHENRQSKSHAETLTQLIEASLKEAHLELHELDAVAVSMGPGSYTGLRIGVSTAKGLCLALDKPLLGINTLQIMAHQVAQSAYGKSLYCNNLPLLFCPMIDARRMEVYTAFFSANLEEMKPSSADIVDGHAYANYLIRHTMLFFGDGATKCKNFLESNPNAIFLDDIQPSAKDMAALAEMAFQKNNFVNLAYFEPFYLKDFYTPPPSIKNVANS